MNDTTAKTILIVGGGTGGHISPGIALYEEGVAQSVRCLFLTGAKDRRFSSLGDIREGDLLYYNAPSFTRNIFKIPFFILRFAWAVIRAKGLIRKNGVDAVVGMGGYVSAPLLFAARMTGTKIFLCEQNTVPGKVTQFFEKRAVRLYGTFRESCDYLKRADIFVHAGNPIRKGVIKDVSRDEAKKSFHLEHCKKIIFVIGGSQGALNLNKLTFGLKKEFSGDLKDVGIIWSTGAFSYDSYKEKVQNEIDGGSIYISPYIDRVGLAYRASDIAISRSGAGVMMELAATGLPSIQIPYPFAALDHQDKNADVFEREGAAVKIKDAEATPGKVAPVLFGLLNNQRSLDKMSQKALALAKSDAAGVIIGDIIKNI